MTTTLREKLHRQIDLLPDPLVEQIVDFTLFVMSRRQIRPVYEDWEGTEWSNFALAALFEEEDEIVYSLNEAEEVYRP